MRQLCLRTALVLFFLAGAAACTSELRVTTVQLGRSVNRDNTVAQNTTTFKPDQTVYVSIHTVGSASGTLGVRWLYEGRVMGEPTKKISYNGASATEFHLENAGGFPTGEYSVEVRLNGQTVDTKKFRVEND